MSPSEKRYVGYLVVSIIVVAAFCVPGSPLSIRGAALSALRLSGSASQKQPPAVDRTTPTLEKMTPAQRHHSEMFEEYRDKHGAKVLDGFFDAHRN